VMQKLKDEKTFDLESGVDIIGDEETFFMLGRKFPQQNLIEELIQLREAIIQIKWEEFRRHAHSIKGAAK